jgi:Phage portal protein, SPP1 Gp6-like
MKRHLDAFAATGLDEALLELLLAEHAAERQPRFERLWAYYRNPVTLSPQTGQRSLAQEEGLPERLRLPGRQPHDDRSSREIVIENDIAWRVQALVDFMFGKPVRFTSLAGHRHLRTIIEQVLDAVLEANGGIRLLQDLALLGSVHGSVDLLVRPDSVPASCPASSRGESSAAAPSNPSALERILARASQLRIETIEAPRSIPLVNPHDYRRLDAYLIRCEHELSEVESGGFMERVFSKALGRSTPTHTRARAEYLEVFSATHHQAYLDGELLVDESLALGRLPIVHIQNLSQPYVYEGLSEVEPLIPLQDELNTRLSDRAHRVTMQSFQMYLGKGIEGFSERPVGPGQMWTTDNSEASIEAFGGDASSPSEESHIREIREALDKTSAVSPLAAGLLRAKVGNLSSENALQITLLGLLTKTERKRITYGRGLAELAELILHTLDQAGVLRTEASDRRVQVVWPNPLPDDASRRLADAKLKVELGVPREQVLAELGYAAADEGVV